MTGPLDAALARLLGETRTDAATAARSRATWLRARSTEEATLLAVLVDLGEADVDVVAGVAGRGATAGRVVLVGADVVVLRTTVGDLVVPCRSLGWVRAAAGAVVPVGGRRIEAGVGLGALLGELAVDRPEVSVGTSCGDRVGGVLRAVGVDVLRIDGAPGSSAGAVTVVPVDAVVDLLVTSR